MSKAFEFLRRCAGLSCVLLTVVGILRIKRAGLLSLQTSFRILTIGAMGRVSRSIYS